MNTTKYHPENTMLMDYASGSLDRACSISVATHLHFCETCKTQVRTFSDIGGKLLEEVKPESVLSDTLSIVLSRIDTDEQPLVESVPRSQSLPPLVEKLLPESGPDWKFLSPSLRVAKITSGEKRFELALHKIKAGGKTPTHDHRGQEITVVLRGSFSDDDGVYHAGDFIVRSSGEVHTPVATANAECICLSVLEAPIKMIGGFKQLLNPFLSFSPS